MINQTIISFWENKDIFFQVFSGTKWYASKLDTNIFFLVFEIYYDVDGNQDIIYYYDHKPYTASEMLRIINGLKVFA